MHQAPPSSSKTDPAAQLKSAFARACKEYGNDDGQAAAGAFIATLAQLLQPAPDILARGDLVEEALATLEDLYSSQHPCSADVLDAAATELLHDLVLAAGRSPSCAAAVRRLVGRFASTSNPRDATTLIIGELTPSDAGLSPGHAALLGALPAAVARLTRRQLPTLADTLSATTLYFAHVFGSLAWDPGASVIQLIKESPKILAGLAELEMLLASFWGDLEAAVGRWPGETQEAARRIAAAHVLLLLGECRMEQVPIATQNPAVSIAARPHFQQAGSGDGVAKAVLPILQCLMRSFRSLEGSKQIRIFTARDLLDDHAPAQEQGQACALPAGWACLLFCSVCDTGLQPERSEPVRAADAVIAVHALLQAASEAKSVAAAQKAFSLAVTVSSGRSERESGELLDPELLRLLELAGTTMAQHPEQILRNCATHAFGALLTSLPVRQMVEAIERVFTDSPAAVSAHAIQALTQTLAKLWPVEDTLPEPRLEAWDMARRYSLPAALDWLSPAGKHSPRDVGSLLEAAEAVCAALNLLRFLLIRERSHASNFAGEFSFQQLLEIREGSLQPLQALVELGLQAVRHGQDQAQGSNAEELALARLLDVLTRVRELALLHTAGHDIA